MAIALRSDDETKPRTLYDILSATRIKASKANVNKDKVETTIAIYVWYYIF